MPNIQLPDGSVVAFPDGMADSDINSAIQKNLSGATAQPAQSDNYSVPNIAKNAVRSLMGIRQGVMDPLNAGAQMLVNAMPDNVQSAANNAMGSFAPTAKEMNENISKNERTYQDIRGLLGGSGIDASRMAGNIATTVPISMALPAVAPESFLGSTATGAGYGALFGSLQPVTSGNDFWDNKLQQAEIGAGTGGITSGAANILSKIINPNISPDVKTLMDSGVTPTPGQIMGGGWKASEDKLSSVPVVGDLIKNAQQRSIQNFNTAIYNKALEPIGETVDEAAGQQGVQAVKNKLSDAYNEILPKVNFAADNQFNGEIANIKNMAQFMPEQQTKQFNNILDSKLYSRMSPQGTMDGQTFKGVESELGQAAKGYLSDPSFDNRQLGSAIQEVQNSARNSLVRTNPDFAPQLKNINQAYANYAIIRNAAAKLGANQGIFTPAQFQNAVRAADNSAGKGNFAIGNARMQDISDAGKAVLGNTYPDSGTTGRSLMTLLGGMMLEGGGAMAGHPLIPLGLGATALPYTTAGQNMAATLLANRPAWAPAAAATVRQLSPFIGAGVVPFALGGY